MSVRGAINRWNDCVHWRRDEMLKVIQVHAGTQVWWWVKKEGFSKMHYANLTTILPLQRGNAQVYSRFYTKIHIDANGKISYLLSTSRCMHKTFTLVGLLLEFIAISWKVKVKRLTNQIPIQAWQTTFLTCDWTIEKFPTKSQHLP